MEKPSSCSGLVMPVDAAAAVDDDEWVVIWVCLVLNPGSFGMRV